MKYLSIIFLLVIFSLLSFNLFANKVLAATVFTVNNLADNDDRSPGDGVCLTWIDTCTLRAAISEANAHSGTDTINFNIPGSGPFIIKPASSLPTLSDASGSTTINGYTQPGASANTLTSGSNAVIKIQLEGAGQDQFGGIHLTSANNVIKGLALYKFRNQVYLSSSIAVNNKVVGNFIGTNADGTYGSSVQLNGAYGVELGQKANNNWIGTANVADKNVISGNGFTGVIFFDIGTDHNFVINNIVGLSPDGTRKLPNLRLGIDVNTGSSYNQIGDGTEQGRNVVSGNDGGIEFSHFSPNGPHNNIVRGNFIGTDLSGNGANANTANRAIGIHLEDGAHDNLVINNVIGNNSAGVFIEGSYTINNRIQGNRIGIGTAGFSMPNKNAGIGVTSSRNNTIGPWNRIVNNYSGIRVGFEDSSPSSNIKITQNWIYSNQSLGIDLIGNLGVTQNDPGDADSGANTLLNFPVINSATTSTISGTVCAGCTVEAFTADNDPTQHGEGKDYVGSSTADSSGNFVLTTNKPLNTGSFVSTTATDSSGNTSEFSLNKKVQ